MVCLHHEVNTAGGKREGDLEIAQLRQLRTARLLLREMGEGAETEAQ